MTGENLIRVDNGGDQIRFPWLDTWSRLESKIRKILQIARRHFLVFIDGQPKLEKSITYLLSPMASDPSGREAELRRADGVSTSRERRDEWIGLIGVESNTALLEQVAFLTQVLRRFNWILAALVTMLAIWLSRNAICSCNGTSVDEEERLDLARLMKELSKTTEAVHNSLDAHAEKLAESDTALATDRITTLRDHLTLKLRTSLLTRADLNKAALLSIAVEKQRALCEYDKLISPPIKSSARLKRVAFPTQTLRRWLATLTAYVIQVILLPILWNLRALSGESTTLIGARA